MAALRDQANPRPEGFVRNEEGEQPILTVATECESNFRKGLQLLSSEGEDKHKSIMQQLEKRFLDWAAYLGVFAGANAGLDQRLKHYPQHRNLILLVLDILKMNLLQITTDPSELSSDDSSDDEADRRKVELGGIQKAINELDRLAIHMRQPSSSFLDVRVKAFASRKPIEVSSFEIKARLTVNVLYPEASKSLRKYLSKSMTKRHMKLLYWRSHEKILRTDRRRDERSGDESAQSRRESSPLRTKGSLPQPSATDRSPISPKPKTSRVSIETSALSGTLASDPDSRFTLPTAEVKIPSPRRAGASTVLQSSPPQFEDGEVEKPCPLCREVFLKANYTDKVWWRRHVNEDLLPFVCISSSCLQSPNFASRSDWRAHIERYHGVFWQQVPSNPIGKDDQSLNPNFQDSFNVGRSADICPLCCLPLDKSRPKSKSNPLLSASSGSLNLDEVLVTSPPESNKDFASTKEGSKKARFDVPKSGSEEEPPEDPTARSMADSETKIVAPMKKSTMDLMLNHIADHLQFLALLTLRLSAAKLSDGYIHTFSSLQSFGSDEDSERTTLDDEIGTAEGYEVPEINEDAFFDKISLAETSLDPISSQNE